jgi:sec-independent protein translocase protein TatA
VIKFVIKHYKLSTIYLNKKRKGKIMGGISIWQLVIIAVIVILLFGTKKLRGIGGDLGGAIKGFKKAIKDEDKPSEEVSDKSDETIKSELEDSKKQDETIKEKTKEKDQA